MKHKRNFGGERESATEYNRSGCACVGETSAHMY